MNWTGGRLQQHSKSRSNRTIRLQKEHFAKERLKTQNSLDSRPFDETLPPFGQLYHELNTVTTPIAAKAVTQARRNRSTRNDRGGTEKPSTSCITDPSSLPTLIRSHSSSKLHTPTPTHHRLLSHTESSFETSRRSLLDRGDWSGLAVAKPLLIKFNHLQEPQMIGRRRKETRSSSYQLLQRRKDTTKPGRIVELHELGHNEQGTAEQGHRPSRKRRKVDHIPSPKQKTPPWNSAPTRSQSDLSTDSLLLEKYEKYVGSYTVDAEVNSECPSKEGTDGKRRYHQSPVLPLSTVRDCTSFDEIRQRTARIPDYLSDILTTCVYEDKGKAGTVPYRHEDNIREEQPRNSDTGTKADLVSSNNSPIRRSSANIVSPATKTTEELGAHANVANHTDARMDATIFSSNAYGLTQQSEVEHSTNSSRPQPEYKPTEELVQSSMKPTLPLAMSPALPDASASMSSILAKRVPVSVSTQTERPLFGCGHNTTSSDQSVIDSVTDLLYTSPQPSVLADGTSKKDCEAWVRAVLAEDFDFVQQRFEPPATSMQWKRGRPGCLKPAPTQYRDRIQTPRNFSYDWGTGRSIDLIPAGPPNATDVDVSVITSFSESNSSDLNPRHAYPNISSATFKRALDAPRVSLPGLSTPHCSTRHKQQTTDILRGWNIGVHAPPDDAWSISLEAPHAWHRPPHLRLTDNVVKNNAGITNRRPLSSIRPNFRNTSMFIKRDALSTCSMEFDIAESDDVRLANTNPRTPLAHTVQSNKKFLSPHFISPRFQRRGMFPVSRLSLFDLPPDSSPTFRDTYRNDISTIDKNSLQADLRSSLGDIPVTRTTHVGQWSNGVVVLSDAPSSKSPSLSQASMIQQGKCPRKDESFFVPSSLSRSS